MSAPCWAPAKILCYALQTVYSHDHKTLFSVTLNELSVSLNSGHTNLATHWPF